MNMRFPRRFAKSEGGSISVEAVFAFPFLVIAMTVTFVAFDAFKTQNITQKATYTIADMLSRERGAMDADYMTAMHEMFDFLSNEDGENGLRVTVVSMEVDVDTGAKTMSIEWSQASGGMGRHTRPENVAPRIPEMANGDQLILVETFQDWTPKFSTAIQSYTFNGSAVTRPRFAPKLVWAKPGGAGA